MLGQIDVIDLMRLLAKRGYIYMKFFTLVSEFDVYNRCCLFLITFKYAMNLTSVKNITGQVGFSVPIHYFMSIFFHCRDIL